MKGDHNRSLYSSVPVNDFGIRPLWLRSHIRPLPLQHIMCGDQLTQSGEAPVQQPGLWLLVSQGLMLGDWLDSSRCSADSHSSLLHVPAGPSFGIRILPMLQHQHICG